MTPPEKNVTSQLVYPTADLRVNPNAPRDIRLALDEACNCYRAGAFKMHEQNVIDGRLFE